jgi:hypothetical protein
MRPEANALNILSTTRATAKMHEFRVAPEDFIDLRRDPSILFALAIGILGDVAAEIADQIRDAADIHGIDPLPVPSGWGDRDPSPTEGLRFASVFFDAFLNSRLDLTITAEFSLLCASAYYLAGERRFPYLGRLRDGPDQPRPQDRRPFHDQRLSLRGRRHGWPAGRSGSRHAAEAGAGSPNTLI